MNLQEQISRIQGMMGLISENELPIHIRRRLPVIQKLLNVILDNSYPCDYNDVNHFKEGILYDIDDFLITFEMEGMLSEEIMQFIEYYLFDDIKKYYINATEDC